MAKSTSSAAMMSNNLGSIQVFNGGLWRYPSCSNNEIACSSEVTSTLFAHRVQTVQQVENTQTLGLFRPLTTLAAANAKLNGHPRRPSIGSPRTYDLRIFGVCTVIFILEIILEIGWWSVTHLTRCQNWHSSW